MKTVILGLDGAAFELIDPWIESGELPNLKKIKEEGVFGDLSVCLPPVTCPNWKCYSTGKNPGKLGIFWWENIDWEKRKVYVPNYRTSSEEIWDYLNDEGIKTAVINMPTTYPPKEVEGYMVAGGPDSMNKNFAYPSSFEKELLDSGYKVRIDEHISSGEDCKKYFDEIAEMMESRFRLGKNLLENDMEIDFLHLTITYINGLHHFLWDDEIVKEGWKVIDDNLEHLVELAEEGEINLLLMSDHGSNRIRDVFNINTWLEREGYLKTKESPVSNIFKKIGLTRSKAAEIAKKIGFWRKLKQIIPNSVTESIPTEEGGVKKDAKERVIDWEESVAVASGQGPIYLNENMKESENKTVRKELIKKLENLESPITGRKIVKRVYRKEEIYSGEYFEDAPDLIIDQNEHIHIQGDIGNDKVFSKPGKWLGENKNPGLFMGYGPDIGSKEIEDISILDLAPTVLHMLELPVPNVMDGQVKKEIFSEDSNAFTRKVKPSNSSKEAISEKVKELKKAGKI